MNRVFRLKLQALLNDLRLGANFKDKAGGPWKARYVMHVIVFQKLAAKPHAHAVMRFVGCEMDMPKAPAAVDDLINARLPEVGMDCDGLGNKISVRNRGCLPAHLPRVSDAGRAAVLLCAHASQCWLGGPPAELRISSSLCLC